ncbi:hypothetical protein Hanom_Chr01g00078381 [Helianthus anomalus]
MNSSLFLVQVAPLCIPYSSTSTVSMAIHHGYTCVHSILLRHTYHQFNRFKIS